MPQVIDLTGSEPDSPPPVRKKVPLSFKRTRTNSRVKDDRDREKDNTKEKDLKDKDINDKDIHGKDSYYK